jgi:hypothetical protein
MRLTLPDEPDSPVLAPEAWPAARIQQAGLLARTAAPMMRGSA